MSEGRTEEEAVSGSTPPADKDRLTRRAQWLAFLCPVLAGAATLGACIAFRLGLRSLGLPLGGPGSYWWICGYGVFPLNGVIGTVGAIVVVCRLHPVPDDRFGLGAIWLFAAPVIYLAAFFAFALTLASLVPP